MGANKTSVKIGNSDIRSPQAAPCRQHLRVDNEKDPEPIAEFELFVSVTVQSGDSHQFRLPYSRAMTWFASALTKRGAALTKVGKLNAR